ncbi:glycerophosphodiester phosphodiesterase [Desulforhopalus singaporensis]|uniref:Glycerophosphoryl diester phosphodiesterase n=1 Tax=Desulforhopalus singaporensis TaxID=91360 RepID=A0A1H0JB85_9BACT|nr:glycerophosphodiester phosphodiesterase family protein [Desulforhopalus singaporensis]SDO41018.1 glycerophosphoryl diester phosphodiesterase [Desulforhopalus singaporensis]
MTFFDNFSAPHLIAAHRGTRAYYPENTLLAFTKSIDRCHFIELDVQLSKDCAMVVIHDSTLIRTTDAILKKSALGMHSLNVSDWTLSQLKSLDAGSWFYHTDPFGTASSKIRSTEKKSSPIVLSIPTLQEVLLEPTLRQVPINIEIKDHKHSSRKNPIVSTAIDIIGQTGSVDRVLLSSFNHDYLIRAKQLMPQLSTAALQSRFNPPNIKEYLLFLGVAAYHPEDSIVTPDLISELQRAGIRVNVFTVNSPKRQKQLFELGATAVITDYPELPGRQPATPG